MAASQTYHHAIASHEAGVRLDRWLCDHLTLSRRDAQRLLGAGCVELDGRVLTQKDKGLLLAAGHRLRGQSVALGLDARGRASQHASLESLAEDDDAIIVNKSADMAVHPLDPAETDTLLNAVIARYPQVHGVGEGGLRSGVVHRLDLDTTGCVAFALSQQRWRLLRDAFASHEAHKLYHAVLRGRARCDRARETMDLHIAQHRPARVRVVNDDSSRRPSGTRRCSLSWRIIEPLRNAMLVEVALETGFLHQIRVMMAHLGHPVIGDALYGSRDAAAAVPRPMLHATALRIGNLAATCPPPSDFQLVLESLRG